MAISWTTFKSWTSRNGDALRVIAATGLIGAGSLLWYDRLHPNYPAAVDEATIDGAFIERWAMFRESYLLNITSQTVYNAGVMGWEVSTNSTGNYPSFRKYYLMAPFVTRQLSFASLSFWPERNFYVDLWGSNEATSGRNKTGARAWAGEFYPYYDSEKMDLTWWQTNIDASAEYFGDFAFLAVTNVYISTNILNQIARPLSAMRWGFIGYESDFPTNSRVRWTTYQAGEDGVGWESRLAACIAAHASATPDSGLDLGDYMVYSHIASISRGGGDYPSATIEETVRVTTKPQWEPFLTNSVRSVWQHGVFFKPSTADYFSHPIDTETNVWEVALIAPTNILGHTYYVPTLYDWSGRMSAIDMQLYGEELTAAGEIEIGWTRKGQQYIGESDVIFLADFKFQCLTNPAIFWNTSYGIR